MWCFLRALARKKQLMLQETRDPQLTRQKSGIEMGEKGIVRQLSIEGGYNA